MINTKTSLGELLTSESEVIRRNATSILKTVQKKTNWGTKQGNWMKVHPLDRI